MIITKTPFRMSFFGGGTDKVEFFKHHGGAVLSTTFDKYCYVTLRKLPPFFDYRTELVYSKIERVKEVNHLEHPLVKNAIQFMNLNDVRIAYDADLPARSGLGTSSSFAVGLLSACHALKGEYAGKHQLAKEAIYLERTLCEESGGWQDQISASFGGFNKIVFYDEKYEVHPVIMQRDRLLKLNNNLFLFFTGFTRISSDVQKRSKSDKDAIKRLLEMKSLVDEAESILVNTNRDLAEFGDLLDYTWQLKKKSGAVSNDSLDEIYKTALKFGARGGKLLGAGQGGFFVFYVEEGKQKTFLEKMNFLLNIPFNFENNGTKIIHYNQDNE